jgi:hypothetical protein
LPTCRICAEQNVGAIAAAIAFQASLLTTLDLTNRISGRRLVQCASLP